jgi:hypothetical protein
MTLKKKPIKGISPAQKAARIKNFNVFRLRGILATLHSIKHDHADKPEIGVELRRAADIIFDAMFELKRRN